MKPASFRSASPLAGLAALFFAAACACGGNSTRPSTSPAPQGGPAQGGPTQQGDHMLTADGKHFAATRLYQGECMPAGSRGGCYSITLEPDGTYRNMLLDAAVLGTYEIKGDQVLFSPNGEALPQTMRLSADRTKLDDYVYKPADAPTQQEP